MDFTFSIKGKQRCMGRHHPVRAGLGSNHTCSLTDARTAAAEARKLVADGIDPIAERERKKEESRKEFEAKCVCAEAERFEHMKANSPLFKPALWDKRRKGLKRPTFVNGMIPD
jgi:hypothetical protein